MRETPRPRDLPRVCRICQGTRRQDAHVLFSRFVWRGQGGVAIRPGLTAFTRMPAGLQVRWSMSGERPHAAFGAYKRSSQRPLLATTDAFGQSRHRPAISEAPSACERAPFTLLLKLRVGFPSVSGPTGDRVVIAALQRHYRAGRFSRLILCRGDRDRQFETPLVRWLRFFRIS